MAIEMAVIRRKGSRHVAPAERRRTYGAGSVYQRKSDGRWVGTIEAGYTRTGARRRLVVTAKTEAEVKRRLRDRQRKFQSEDGEATVSDRTTVKAWSDQWLKITEHTSRPKTFTTEKGAVTKWIVPTIGHRRLDQLVPADIRAVSNAIRDAGISTTTANRYHGVLLRILKAAIAEGHSVPRRVLDVEPPKRAVNDRQAMTTDEAVQLLTAPAGLGETAMRAAALLQGMRRGECLGLTWPAVDLDRQILSVSWQLQALPYIDPRDKARGFRVPDGYEARHLVDALHLVRPKSKAGWRVIPLVPWMAAALTAWHEQAPPNPYGLVWTADNSRPIEPRDATQAWYALQRSLGVQHPAGRPYKLHEARHTTATLLMELGVDESVRIAIMGHSSIAVTRGYEYVNTAQTRLALEAVAERLGLGAPGA